MKQSKRANAMRWWGLTLGLIGSLCSVGTTFGQGFLLFRNFGWVNAPVYDVDGKTPLGPGFLAELYVAAPGSSLAPVSSSITPFKVLGYFFGDDLAVPGVLGGQTAVVQVVAWRASDGGTFEEANHPGGHVGASAVLEVTLNDPLGRGDLAFLDGLQSFSLHEVVPEPSALVLGLVGGVALMLRRWVRETR